ncbi:hypothetical protein [Streptomyces albipurpureus]|uniref:Uncharacterized protein n=1 Tax=Streptomyces albipurpureus TaxID=2897419 RepID=A0ABT0UK05_9ACTN|nr:hypothetical protein [Streptomyces sp. CWNU-1]MCM2388947.1 hypothetical protein [Streptomyces sp. CWNU-1]
MRHEDDHALLEDELRVLLERGTPLLRAPEGRLRQVRERVTRRRRRLRMAGATATGAAALTLAGALLLPTTEEAQRPALPAAPPSTGVMAPLAEPVSFPELNGLTIELPERWSALAVPADTVHPDPLGFLGAQSLAPFTRPCQLTDPRDCAPVRRLGRGDVLITLSGGWSGKQQASETASRALSPSAAPDEGCEAIGGVTKRGVALLDDGKPNRRILATFRVCAAAGTTDATWAEVQTMIDNARLGGSASPAPSPSKPPSSSKAGQ